MHNVTDCQMYSLLCSCMNVNYFTVYRPVAKVSYDELCQYKNVLGNDFRRKVNRCMLIIGVAHFERYFPLVDCNWIVLYVIVKVCV